MSHRWNIAERISLARLVRPRETDALLAPWIRHWPNLVAALVKEGPHAVALHLYEMLSRMGIHYAWEPLSWDRQTQLVRSPAQVVRDGKGTCLELALQFAACLEENRVHPIVVILEGHALVAFWKGYWGDRKPPFERSVRSSEPAIIRAAPLRRLLDRNEIVPVECTGFALLTPPITATLASSFEGGIRTRKPPTDKIPPLSQPRSDPDPRDKLIEYVDAQALGAVQIQKCKVLFGVCIAAARAQEIYPVTYRDAAAPQLSGARAPVSLTRARVPPPRVARETLTGQYIVGRKEEVRLLSEVVNGTLPHVVNIYGPGGIGKTVVCHKVEAWCRQEGIPYATVAESDLIASTIGQMLFQFKEGLEGNVPGRIPEGIFDEFAGQFREHMTVQEVIDGGGEFDQLFDPAGNPRHQRRLKTLLGAVGRDRTRIERHFVHRMALERYIGGGDGGLTDSFVGSVTRLVEDGSTKVVLLIDTYEMLMEGVDDWMCETFVKALPPGAKVIILGRDRLSRRNHDWSQYGKAALLYHELPELSEEDAKEYLRHHDLQDEHALEGVYRFTKGYPLCLALAVELARELGGWKAVRGFKASAHRDRVAHQLLERILRQLEVEEVREFLEKGVVTEWFDPGLVGCILDVSPERGREIYDKIAQFSFVHPHPKGLQFHDTVRELLVARLKFMDNGQTYGHLVLKCREYYGARAGLRVTARQSQG